MQGIRKSQKGFTLIELLVVIAIIAILSVVVILTLNPAELLRQSRDSNRISDMSVLKSAIGYYLATAASPSIGTSTCYQSAPVGSGTSTAACAVFFRTATSSVAASSTQTDGTGWLPINFSGLTGGSPLGALPQDPLTAAGTNDRVHIYGYIASSTQLTFKLDAHMESLKYGYQGSNDVVSTDGGIDSASYEQGTNLQL
jgi:prepilin-type N-terminal cleavage/methylation domain-containing protein